MARVCLVFKEPGKLSFKIHPHLLSTNAEMSSCCYTSAPALSRDVVDLAHADRFEDRPCCFSFQCYDNI